MNQTMDGMMRLSNYLLVMALGIALVSLFPVLNLYVFGALCAACLLVLVALYWTRQPPLIVLLCLLIGLCWGAGYGLKLLGNILPVAHEQQLITIVGEVVDLPELGSRQGLSLAKFDFQIEQARCDPACRRFPTLIKLSWLEHPQLVPGQRWQLTVKLKRPHGFMNPGGFDYESWLIQCGIGAVGYVRENVDNRLLGQNRLSVDHWRWQLSNYLDSALQGMSSRPILKALLIADKRGITQQQWELFRHHGIIHLMVISGLHVGLVSGFAYTILRLVLLVSGLTHRADHYAAIAAMLVAVHYSLAAGLSLPTQRALIMVSCVMGMVLLQRRFNATLAIALAMLCCLLLDPLAVISTSFWLSFGAVSILLIGLVGKVEPRRRWRLAIHSQWLVFIGLIPLLAFGFGEVSLDAPLVNLVFVPVFGLLVVPLNFLALALSAFNQGIGGFIWQQADHLIQGMLQCLSWLEQQMGSASLSLPGLPLTLLLLSVAGVVLLAAPRGLPLRGMGIVFLIPLFIYRAESPQHGELQVSVLDVGQGLTVVMRTAQHVLVYDVGARFPQGEGQSFVVAEAVLLPYLRRRGVEQLDMLVLSHNDNDHAGGWREVVAAIRPQRLVSGEPLQGQATEACNEQVWQWDGLIFQFLATDVSALPAQDTANNRSCVLLVKGPAFQMLLPGDIDSDMEKQLLTGQRLPESIDLLLAPHHGSASSSSWALLKTIKPRHVVFSAGYRNQFGHPHPKVVRRYQHFASSLHNTSEHGAIEFHIGANGMLTTTHYRQLRNRFWL